MRFIFSNKLTSALFGELSLESEAKKRGWKRRQIEFLKMQKFIVVFSAVIFGSFARSIPVDLPDDGSAFHVTRQKRQFGFA